MIVFYAAIFAWFLCSFGPPSRALGAYTPKEQWDMLFHDGVGVNGEKRVTTEIQAQEPSIWAKSCTLDESVYVIRLDMTTLPWWRENVMEY